ncbi:unnamed protein product [Parnassius mnemosyne]|uniref:Elongation of very long chain fatty acids protein n=1 Tax=Parnassius mnemosyne TaxID=213953 RepID=A0AAV1MCE1_9NEOP
MYFYYALTVCARRYAWWRKHVTQIQLLQFVLDIFVMFYHQYQTPCPMPLSIHWFAVLTTATFFGLFMDFYLKRYGSKIQKVI